MWFNTCINNNWSGHNCRSKTEINFAAVNRLNRSVVVNQQIALVIGQLTELRQLKWKFHSSVECTSKWMSYLATGEQKRVAKHSPGDDLRARRCRQWALISVKLTPAERKQLEEIHRFRDGYWVTGVSHLAQVFEDWMQCAVVNDRRLQ